MILQIMIKVLKIHSFLKNEQGPTLTDVKSKKNKSPFSQTRGQIGMSTLKIFVVLWRTELLNKPET